MSALDPLCPYYDKAAETRPRSDIEATQLDRLRLMVGHTYERSPMVRHAWDAAGVHPRDVDSLAHFVERAPFVDKETLDYWRTERNDPYAGLLCIPADEVTTILSSSGTTSEPTLAPQHWAPSDGPVPAGMSRGLWMMGLRPGEHISVVIFTFRGPAYGMVQQFGAVPILFDYDADDMVRFCELSLRYRPTGLYNLSSTIVLAIADAIEAGGFDARDVFSSYRALVAAGEPLGAQALAVVQSWGAPMFEHTGVGDVTTAFECPEHDGLHLWEDDAFVECLDPNGTEPVGDGEVGELVATELVNATTPLIRYRSDDLVRLTRRTCACGRTHARVWPVGRKGDGVEIDGRTVLPIDVWPAVESVEECGRGLFQIVRTGATMDRLRLRVGYAPGAEARLDSVRQSVAAAVATRVGLVPEVELVTDAQLLALGPPHKIPRVAAL